MTQSQALGCTELRVDKQTVSWNIKGIQSIFETKLLPVWNVQSPTFETNTNSSSGSASRKWHLQLVQSKDDFLKCILIEEISVEHYNHNFANNPIGSISGYALNEVQANLNVTATSASAITGSSRGATRSAITVPGQISEMLTTAANAESTSGAIISNAFVVTRDGRLESFGDIVEKNEETSGWKEWAGKFVEKRRKAGFTEYIFGKDEEAYENAVPLNYLFMYPDRYLDSNGALDLQVELVFTSTVKIPAPTTITDEIPPEVAADRATIESQRNLNNAMLAQKLAGFLKVSHLSDFTLECEGRSFPVHKIILEARAPSLLANFLSRPRILPSRPCDRTPAQLQNQNQNQTLINQFVEEEDSNCSCSCSEAGSEDTCSLYGENIDHAPRAASGNGTSSNNYASNDNANGVSAPPVCPCISPAFRAQSIVVTIDNIRSNILEIILQFIYEGTLSENLNITTLDQVSREARKYNCHDLTYLCFLRCLSLYRDCSPDLEPVLEQLMADIFTTADKCVFENCSLSLLELRKLHPLAFLHLDNLSA